jgi:hypothetical protein
MKREAPSESLRQTRIFLCLSTSPSSTYQVAPYSQTAAAQQIKNTYSQEIAQLSQLFTIYFLNFVLKVQWIRKFSLNLLD